MALVQSQAKVMQQRVHQFFRSMKCLRGLDDAAQTLIDHQSCQSVHIGPRPGELRRRASRNGPNPVLPEPGSHWFVGDGDGWIFATVWRAASNTSDLAIFGAQNVAAGSVCVASLPHRVADGFHGNWFAPDTPVTAANRASPVKKLRGSSEVPSQ